MRSVLTGAALVGAGVTLCGCGGDPVTTKEPAPTTPAPTPAPVQTAWDNHFAAFGAGAAAGAADKAEERKVALDNIMKDYDANSKIAVFNDKCTGTNRNGYEEYNTEAEIRGFFDALFLELKSNENLDAVGPSSGSPVVFEGDSSAANVFLTWRTKNGIDIETATDSFSFKETDGKAMIAKQNIVVTQPIKTCTDNAVTTPAACTAQEKIDNKVCAGWDNHFTYFDAGCKAASDGAMNSTLMEEALDRIMDDYTEDSIIQVFDNRDKAYSIFDSRAKIRTLFEGLFTDINKAKTTPFDPATNGVEVLVLEVEKDRGVFLVWTSNSHPKATDTFVFNSDGKIIRQNIVVTTKTEGQASVQV